MTCRLQAPDIARIDAVEDSRVLAKQNLALAIVVKQQKSQEQEAAHMFTLMEASSNQLQEDIVFLGNTIAQKNADNQTYRNRIHKLEDQLANNQADLVWNLRENITLLEQSAEETGWDHFSEISQLEWRHSSDISQLREDIAKMCSSIQCQKSNNKKYHQENRHLSGEVNRLLGLNNTLSDDNLSLFPSSDEDESN